MRPMPIVVPWEFCATANHRLLPVIRWFKNKPKAMLITNPEYSVAKQGAEYRIRGQWKGQPMTVAVELVARCWFPDARKRDASNLSKLIGDSLTGIVLEDDSQIHRETYERAGIDKGNPRVEITVRPMPEIAVAEVADLE